MESQSLSLRMKMMKTYKFKRVFIPLFSFLAIPCGASGAGEEAPVTSAIVNVSVCNLRSSGNYGAEMSTQALMGMPMRILENGNWMKIQTPDDYVAWVLSSSVVKVSDERLKDWNRAEQVVATCVYGFVYSQPDKKSQTVSDIVGGNRFKYLGKQHNYLKVGYPDGRVGYIHRGDGEILSEWRKENRQDANSILATAKRMMGIPYLWGGTSTKGMDCSGFVRTVLLMHDIIIPRDANPQCFKGLHLDILPDFSNLIPGDLLFFGSKGEDLQSSSVVHVGIYMGDKKFIHSMGCVHVSSFDPRDSEYDEYDLNRLLWAQRILPYINKEEGLTTTETNIYYR